MKDQKVPKSATKALEKFKAALKAFAEETEETNPDLYEDAWTSFKVIDPKLDIETGVLSWTDEEGRFNTEYYLTEEVDEDDESTYLCWDRWEDYKQTIRYWNAALRKAKRYWSMDCEQLDKITDGEAEDIEDDEE